MNNREILFRAKRIDNGEWIEGYYYPQFDDLSIAYILCKNKGIVYEVIPESVGQFTGLLDKNGKRIFEHDIILVYEDCCGEIKTWENIVCFKNGCFSLYDPNCCKICRDGFGITCNLYEAVSMWECKVVGNISDNTMNKDID